MKIERYSKKYEILGEVTVSLAGIAFCPLTALAAGASMAVGLLGIGVSLMPLVETKGPSDNQNQFQSPNGEWGQVGDGSGNTDKITKKSLHRAVKNMDLSGIEQLFGSRVEVTQIDDGEPPLIIAAKEGKEDVVKQLIEDYGIEKNEVRGEQEKIKRHEGNARLKSYQR